MYFYCVISFALLCAVAALWRAVADHYQLRRQLREMERRAANLQRMIRERGELANELAHEIKNPISAILCSAEALDLLVGDRLEGSHRKCLNYIREYGDTLLHLVSDFIDLSRAETGNIKVERQPVPLKPLVEGVIGLLQSSAIRKHINVSHSFSNEGLQAHADPRHIKQVLFNLVHNALKCTPEKGVVRVSIEQDRANKRISFTVSDSGIGISESEMPQLFNPYSQIKSKEGRTSLEGTGLGLAVCRVLLELQSGQISARNLPTGGACFEFSVPEYTGEAAQRLERQHIDTNNKPLAGQSFLLANQDNGSRDAMAQLIKAWGGVVDQVNQASDAVKALNQKSYDAVMVDCDSEGFDEAETAQRIRKEAQSKNTTVIVAASEQGTLDLAQDYGADKSIKKPMEGAALLDSLLHTGKFSITQ